MFAYKYLEPQELDILGSDSVLSTTSSCLVDKENSKSGRWGFRDVLFGAFRVGRG